MKHKICVITSTRAEYGLLKPVLERIAADSELELCLIVSGTHLAKAFGYTVTEIEADQVVITAKVEALPLSDSSKEIARCMGQIMIEMSELFEQLRPELLLVLGDRYEIFAAVTAAYTMNLPVAHIAGGEVTAGALDEGYRHSISKMSRLHFTANTRYQKRVIQLGEDPDSVIVSGDTGAENIRQLPLLSRQELAEALSIPADKPYILATYHPVTIGEQDTAGQMHELFAACREFPDIHFIFTKANADSDGRKINQMLDEYARQHPANVSVFASLGQIRYLSAMKYCLAVLGNSSSGILEAPTMGRPTVNIGSRQDGRLRAKSIIDCQTDRRAIIKAINQAISPEFQGCLTDLKTAYNQKTEASLIIVKEIKRFLKSGQAKTTKRFYDLPDNE